MLRDLCMPARALPWAVLVAALMATSIAGPARGAPSRAGADSLSGVWRDANDRSQLMTVNATPDGGAVFLCQGHFRAITLPRDGGYIGIARLPDLLKVESSLYQYRVLHVMRIDPTMLHLSFSPEVERQGPDAQVWEFVGRFGTDAAATKVAADSTLPKFGDYVYVEDLPEASQRVPPQYPTAAREKGIQGTVMVQALVGRDGLVKDAMVVYSVPGLDEAALAAVRQWRFKPAAAKGKPVAVWVAVPVKFTLH